MTEQEESLYDRQEELDLQTPDKAVVIGVGGIGSWAALNMALAGTETIYLVDPDHIENHNLNRTPYKQTQIDRPKAEALAELIYERRTDAEVIPLVSLVENLHQDTLQEFEGAVVIDCRDNAASLPDPIEIDVTAGYDGHEATLHFNPNFDTIWGDGGNYETVPSFVAPPAMIASIITSTIFTGGLPDEETIQNFNTKDAVEKLTQ